MEATLNSPVIFLTLAAAAAASWYVLDHLYIPRHLPDEPPAVRSSIPYLGHIIGLLRHGIKYYEITRCVFSHLAHEDGSLTYF